MARNPLVAFFTLSCCLLACPAVAQVLPLEAIMADPVWIGPAVEGSFWALDGESVYYRVQRDSSSIRDLRRITLVDGADRAVSLSELGDVDADGAVFDRSRQRAIFVRNGDVFLRNLGSGRLTQITRSAEGESSPAFSSDQSLVYYRRGMDWWSHDSLTGLDSPFARVVPGKDPDDKKPGDLEQWQLRLSTTLRGDKERREGARANARAQRQADPTREPEPLYLGEEAEIVSTTLSPSGRWMLVVTAPKGAERGRVGKMPLYVTESGYEETEDTRVRVGRNAPSQHTLWHVDLESRTVRKLPYRGLPGITDDPFVVIRAENAAAARSRGDSTGSERAASPSSAKRQDKHPVPAGHATPVERGLQVNRVEFTADGAYAALSLRAIDNKDRWIVTVDSAGAAPALQHRLSDPAWINWNFNDLGWLPDARTLWFLSEESGYSHLYRKGISGKSVALTSGRFECSAALLSPDGKSIYLKANAQAPYAYDVHRVAVTGGPLERLTSLDAVERFRLSPDGTQLLLEHSATYIPMQLSVAPAREVAVARRLTDTRTVAFRSVSWIQPSVVGVPSSHTTAPIWSRLYVPSQDGNQVLRPIVLFVHGAGYLQNTTLGYPHYFREQMFHNRLVQQGYLVLDMDYRASEGYGRDWRTAIYRNMGTPELEDLIDGVNWLVKEHRGDPKRVGLYGGSYGGFMTMMALFKAPEVFRAGAALRPVTDWTTYNHGYTSNILNTPQVDDLAYRRSSPIEFAEGLRGSLLICHGMIDDNVLFQDSVRLLQRLIELHKDDVELAPYPLERHGFTHPDSWLDEYKRIDRLFESRLR